MELDEDICLCFHVSKRKVMNFLRVEQPRRVSQLSECHGAGTGCGWCRPFLKQLFEQFHQLPVEGELPVAEEYASRRAQYIQSGQGTPPSS